MPTVLTHAAVPLAIGLGLGSRTIAPRLLVAGLVASMLPDADVLAFHLGIPYADAFGHRGATHSLAFAILLGLLALTLAGWLRSKRKTAFCFVSLSALSHGLLDMFTNGGHGIALWWPISDQRLFFPWHVIEVSPLSLQRILSKRGIEVMQSELLWVWLPALTVCCALLLWRLRSNNRH